MFSNISFTVFPLQHYAEDNENLAYRRSRDNDKLWEVLKGF
jgi:hypothetical protein